MEDLRDEKTKSIEEGVKPKLTKWGIFVAILTKINFYINFYIKKILTREYALQYYIILGILLFLIAKYPLEIGTFIGDWMYYIWSGLTKNFK